MTSLRKTKQRSNAGLLKTIEEKTLTVDATPAANSTGNLTLLNAITKGTTDNTRVGTRVNIRRLQIRGFCAVTPTTGVDQLHRVMLIVDQQANAAAPTLATILQATTVYSFPDPEYVDRFRIIYDRTFALNATAESGSIIPFNIDLRTKVDTHFNASAYGDIRDIISGSIYLGVIGTSAAGGTAGSVNLSTIVRFTDL